MMANNSSLMEEEYYPLVKQPMHMIIIYSLAYSTIFLCALVGNMMVIAVVYRHPRMHTVTNYFIINLAFADILVVIFCLPITLMANLFTGWRYGAFLCKATPYLQAVAVCASVNTLGAIAIDRYLAICYTLQFKITGRVCRIIIIGIWIFSLVIMIPWAIFFKQIEYPTNLQLLYLCHGDWPSRQVERAYTLGAVFLSCYTIPLLLIIVCYVLIGYRVWNRDAPGISNSSGVIYKSKVKVVKMLAVVVMLFALSWLPIYIIRLRQLYIEFENDEGTEELMMYEVFVPIAQWLGSSNSGANPIIYCFFSKRFRRGFKNMMSCRTQKQSDLQRQVSRYSSTKYMTVDYANGHVTLSFKKEIQDDDDSSSTRTYV